MQDALGPISVPLVSLAIHFWEPLAYLLAQTVTTQMAFYVCPVQVFAQPAHIATTNRHAPLAQPQLFSIVSTAQVFVQPTRLHLGKYAILVTVHHLLIVSVVPGNNALNALLCTKWIALTLAANSYQGLP